MSEMTNQQYAEYVKRKSPASPIWGDLLRAFLIGGAICALGQVITELWVLIGLEEAEAGTASRRLANTAAQANSAEKRYFFMEKTP